MSTERDELTDLLSDVIPQVQEYADAFGEIADAVLAAGYRKPSTIITAEELDALPDCTVVLDCDNDPWQKEYGGWNNSNGARQNSNLVAHYAPLTVLHEPEARS